MDAVAQVVAATPWIMEQNRLPPAWMPFRLRSAMRAVELAT